jgi:hypothetical protein
VTGARQHLWLALAACVAVAILLAAGQTVSAQCAMCKSAIAGAPEAARLSARLNLAVLVLLIPPVAIFCGIFYAAFRQRKAREESAEVNEETRIKPKTQPFAP